MSLHSMQSLVSVLRLLESTETPMEEYKEEPVLNEGNHRDRVAEFLLNLNDTVDGNTQIGPYKIYYEPSDFYIYEDASDGFINKVVLNESFVWPTYSGTINNVKYAVYEERHTGGGLGMPFPGTYEQEYDMFKTKGPQQFTAMTNEALDSSYPYTANATGYKFYFTTDKGIEYYVYFAGKDLVEVAFSSRTEDDGTKTTLTGTGHSRKVLGTVIAIVKEFLDTHSPNALYFTGEGSEPSRIKLYDRLISQADQVLPNYYAAKAVDLGDGKAYMLKRKDATVTNENAGSTITLTKLYGANRPDDNEVIWDYGTMIWDDPFEIKTINPNQLEMFICDQYNVEFIDDLFDRMSKPQHKIVNSYIKDPNLSNYIIVLDDGYIVDGNHRAIAAALTKKPIRYIDIGEDNEQLG